MANKKISNLTGATSVTDASVFPVVDSGATKKVTGLQIKTHARSGLSTVATSGSYTDLTNKPTIPSITGLATETYVDNAVNAITIPTNLSDLNQDELNLTGTAIIGANADVGLNVNVSGYIYSELELRIGSNVVINSAGVKFPDNTIQTTAYTGPVSVPTNLSQLTNDAGFITSWGQADWNEEITESPSYIQNKPQVVHEIVPGFGLRSEDDRITGNLVLYANIPNVTVSTPYTVENGLTNLRVKPRTSPSYSNTAIISDATPIDIDLAPNIKTVNANFTGSLTAANIQGVSSITFTDDTVQTTAYTGQVGGTSYDQSLNTTDSPAFSGLSVGGELNLYTVKQVRGSYVNCQPNVDTVIYTATGQWQHTIKLLVQVEGQEGGQGPWETQSCEIIVSKSFLNNKVAGSVYGLVYTSNAALATFTARWNNTTSRVEVVCRPESTISNVVAHAFATEISTAD